MVRTVQLKNALLFPHLVLFVKRKSSSFASFDARLNRLRHGRVHQRSLPKTEKDGAVSGTVRERREFRRRRRPGSDVLPNTTNCRGPLPKGRRRFGRRRTRWDSNSRSSAGSRGLFQSLRVRDDDDGRRTPGDDDDDANEKTASSS